MLVLGGCRSGVSDTGFRGRWERGGGADVAQVSIWNDGRGWHFCWSTPALEHGPTYACTADGRTVMSEHGEATYAYVTTMTPDATGRAATIEVVGEPLLAELTPIRWTDRLELEGGGLAIASWKVALNGQALDPPRGPLRLVKVADDPH
jgi:hypothetical protein